LLIAGGQDSNESTSLPHLLYRHCTLTETKLPPWDAFVQRKHSEVREQYFTIASEEDQGKAI
jgi:hypothetical protein